MAVANLCTTSSFAAFFTLPLFIQDLGGSKADIGVLMGAFALASVLCRPWVSTMVDRFGRRRSYTVGSLIMTLLPLCYLFIESCEDLSACYAVFLGMRIIHGVGLAICFTAAFTFVADIVPQERLNEGIGVFGISGLTGLGLGPALAEPVIGHLGFSAFFLTASAVAGIGLVCHLPLADSFTFSRQSPRVSFLQVLRTRKNALVALLSFLFGVGISASGNFVFPFVEERQYVMVSAYFLSYSAAAILTRLLGGRLADRVGEERVMPYAFVIAGLGFLVLLLPAGSAVLFPAGLLCGCGHGFLFPCLNAMAVRREPAHLRGKVTGAFTGSIDAGVFLGSILLGYLGEWLGFGPLFISAAVVLFLGLAVFRLDDGELGLSQGTVPRSQKE